MKKNPHYYDADKVRIPEIHYLIIPESSLGLKMYEDNELDILGASYLEISSLDLGLIKLDPILREQQHHAVAFCTESYNFNVYKAPFDTVLVRKAISAAINKRALIDFVIQGGQEPANTFTRPPVFGSVDPSLKVGIDFNPIQAKKWLTEAGYPDGNDFPEIEILVNNNNKQVRIAKAIKLMLKHYLEIDTKINIVDFETYAQRLSNPNAANLIRFGWCGDYPDANDWLHRVFHPQDGLQVLHWQHDEFARITALAQQKTVSSERLTLYHQAEKILNEDYVAIIPLYFGNATYLVKPWLKDWYHMTSGGQHIRDWGFVEDDKLK